MGKGQRSVRPLAAALCAVVTMLVAAACGPPPGQPPSPHWAATLYDWNRSPGTERDQALAVTSDTWLGIVRAEPNVDAGGTRHLDLYRRSGPDGAPAATPAQTFAVGSSSLWIAMSDHVVVVRSRDAAGTNDLIDLYGLNDTNDTWLHSGTISRAATAGWTGTVDVSDTTLALGDAPGLTATGDGSATLLPVSVSPTGFVGLGAYTTLTPDPSWPAADRAGFGKVLSTEGDWLAVSTTSDRVLIAHRSGFAWTTDTTLVNPGPAALMGHYGHDVAIDAEGPAPRLLVGVTGGSTGIGNPLVGGRAELWTRGGAGWSNTQTITPRPSGLFDGVGIGNEVALDGDRAVVGYNWAEIPGVPPVTTVQDFRLELWNVAGVPAFEAELSMYDPLGGPRPDQTGAGGLIVNLSSSHVAVTSSESYGADPSKINVISFDRHPAS